MKAQNRFSRFFVCNVAVAQDRWSRVFSSLLLKRRDAVKTVAWLLTGLVLAMPVSAAVFTVNSAADVGAGVPGNCVADGTSLPNTCRLRDAIAAAAANGDVIAFSLPAGSTIGLTSQLVVNKSLTIDGSGSSGLTVASTSNFRVFSVGSGVTVAFSNFTIANGDGTGGTGNGGNISNAGTLTLTNCTVKDGNVRGNNNGGGISNTGTLTLISSTVSNNDSTNNGGGIYNTGTLTLTNSTVSGNSANDAGRGIYNSGTLTLTNATVAGNGNVDIHSTAASLNFRITNTIVQSCSGTVGTDNGGNLTTTAGNCNFNHTDSATVANLNLNALADNGGPTLTMMPNTSSAALGLGLPGVCAGPPVNGVDQRGFLRAAPPTACTSGAVEYRPLLTVNVTGGGSVSEDPAGQINACTDAPVGNECTNTYSHGTTVTLEATPPSIDHGVTWGGDCTVDANDPLRATVLMDADKTCTATFALLQRTLTVNVVGGGSVSETPAGQIVGCTDTPVGNECTNTYEHDTTVTLVATLPSVNHSVTWGGDCTVVVGDPLRATVLMDANKTCTATFALLQRTLTVIVAGDGSVSETPAGQIAGCTDTPVGNECTNTYEHGTTVVLTATPGMGYHFVSWTGSGCTVSNPSAVPIELSAAMTEDRICTATFALRSHTLDVIVVGDGSVSETPAGQIDDCTATTGVCTGAYTYNTTVTLTATPDTYWVFDHWAGDSSDCIGNTPTITVTMEDDYTCSATFIARTYREIIVTKEVNDVTGTGYNATGVSSGRFNITVTCDGTPYPLQLADSESNALNPIQVPVNAVCTVEETVPADVINANHTNIAAISPSGFTATYDQEVLVTNRIEQGTVAKAMVRATKVLSGDPADILAGHDPETVFYIAVSCGPNAFSMTQTDLGLKAGESGTVEGEVGDICVIDEPVYTPARPGYQYVWSIWPMETRLRFAGEVVEVTVDNKVIPHDPRGFYALTLKNEVSGPNPNAYDPTGWFVLSLNCGPGYIWPSRQMHVGDKAGYSIPVGLTCTTDVISKPSPNSGYEWRGETYSLQKTFVTRDADEDGVVTHNLQQRNNTAAPIPTLDPKALLLLIGLLTGFAFWQSRNQRSGVRD
jgi:hypothetical protein